MPPAAQPRQPAGAAVLRPEKTKAIVSAFFAELAESGYEGMTMDRVSQRAGVGKAALYRRWPSKREMLVELVGQFATQAVLPPDTGSLEEDLAAVIDEAIAVVSDPIIRGVIQSLVAEGPRTPDLAAVLTERFRKPRRAAGVRMLQRAIERGEIAPDVDTELFNDLVGGALYLRAIILDEPFPPDYAERLATTALRTIGATSSRAE